MGVFTRDGRRVSPSKSRRSPEGVTPTILPGIARAAAHRSAATYATALQQVPDERIPSAAQGLRAGLYNLENATFSWPVSSSAGAQRPGAELAAPNVWPPGAASLYRAGHGSIGAMLSASAIEATASLLRSSSSSTSASSLASTPSMLLRAEQVARATGAPSEPHASTASWGELGTPNQARVQSREGGRRTKSRAGQVERGAVKVEPRSNDALAAHSRQSGMEWGVGTPNLLSEPAEAATVPPVIVAIQQTDNPNYIPPGADYLMPNGKPIPGFGPKAIFVTADGVKYSTKNAKGRFRRKKQRLCGYTIECDNAARGASGLCIQHGGGRRCSMSGCTNGAENGGNSLFCKRHGGGRRCQGPNCDKSARGGTPFCISHGGGRRCLEEGCTKAAADGSEVCITHGGKRRCRFPGHCKANAQKDSPFCRAHHGDPICELWSCNRPSVEQFGFRRCELHPNSAYQEPARRRRSRGGSSAAGSKSAHGASKRASKSAAGSFCSAQQARSAKESSLPGASLATAKRRLCNFPRCPNHTKSLEGFCENHTRGAVCIETRCPRRAVFGHRVCSSHGGPPLCETSSCATPAARGATLCVRHGGGPKCAAEQCARLAVTGGLCALHGSEERLQVANLRRSNLRKHLADLHASPPDTRLAEVEHYDLVSLEESRCDQRVVAVDDSAAGQPRTRWLLKQHLSLVAADKQPASLDALFADLSLPERISERISEERSKDKRRAIDRAPNGQPLDASLVVDRATSSPASEDESEEEEEEEEEDSSTIGFHNAHELADTENLWNSRHEAAALGRLKEIQAKLSEQQTWLDKLINLVKAYRAIELERKRVIDECRTANSGLGLPRPEHLEQALDETRQDLRVRGREIRKLIARLKIPVKRFDAPVSFMRCVRERIASNAKFLDKSPFLLAQFKASQPMTVEPKASEAQGGPLGKRMQHSDADDEEAGVLAPRATASAADADTRLGPAAGSTQSGGTPRSSSDQLEEEEPCKKKPRLSGASRRHAGLSAFAEAAVSSQALMLCCDDAPGMETQSLSEGRDGNVARGAERSSLSSRPDSPLESAMV